MQFLNLLCLLPCRCEGQTLALTQSYSVSLHFHTGSRASEQTLGTGNTTTTTFLSSAHSGQEPFFPGSLILLNVLMLLTSLEMSSIKCKCYFLGLNDKGKSLTAAQPWVLWMLHGPNRSISLVGGHLGNLCYSFGI